MPEEQKGPNIEQLIGEELIILNRKFVELQGATKRVINMYEMALHPEKFKKKEDSEPDFQKPKGINEDKTVKKDK